MSVNHQYVQFYDKVVKRYKKTTPGAITGRRLNPANPNEELSFILTSDKNSYKVDWVDGEKPVLSNVGFNYDTEVLELYSDTEVNYFQRMNRNALMQGLFVEYTQPTPEVELQNALDDESITEIAALKQTTALRKRLQEITSIHTLNRIHDAARRLNRPMSIIDVIQDRINDITE